MKGDVKQLTSTSAIERSAMFLNNGNVAYQIDNKFFEHNLNNNSIDELASLIMQKDPQKENNAMSYLAKEQKDLIEYIALQQRNKTLIDNKKERLKAQNQTITQSEFYFSDNERIVHASLSPNGDKMIVGVADNLPSRDLNDIMPDYISDSGIIKSKKVRHRVANNRQYKQRLYLLDLKTGQKFPLKYNNVARF